MVALLKRLLVSVSVAALVGCGGNSISNPAHLRFFNGFSDRTNARLYVGGILYSAPGVGASIEYANNLSYGKAQSGSESIVANPYVDPTTTWASLSSQAVVAGVNYTLIGATVSGTRQLFWFEDGVAPAAGSAFVRILDAAGTLSPIYYTLRQASDNTIVYSNSSGQAVGTSSGYRSVAVSVTTGVPYLLNVYTSSTFLTSISGDIPVTLQAGTPTTVVLYNTSDGRVHAKTGTDVLPN